MKFDVQALGKTKLREYYATEQRIAGATCYRYEGGRADGTRAVQVKTGTGFSFEILPDRGMDIRNVEYCGIPISWEGKCGVVHPAYYESEGLNVMRTFLGGMVSTCGLTNAGSPCEDNDILFAERQGLHGRINYIAAEDVCVRQGWQEEEYCISVSGKMRETRLYCENLLLMREVRCKMGESRFTIHDSVENLGFEETPLMLLYHVNFGYPVVSPQSSLYTGYEQAEPFNEFAREKWGASSGLPEPLCGYKPDNIRFTKPKHGDDNYAAFFNPELDFGAYVRYQNSELPYMTEWIHAAKQEYVVGIEPGNCLPEGRVEARRNRRLEMLAPGQVKEVNMEIGIIESQVTLKDFLR